MDYKVLTLYKTEQNEDGECISYDKIYTCAIDSRKIFTYNKVIEKIREYCIKNLKWFSNRIKIHENNFSDLGLKGFLKNGFNYSVPFRLWINLEYPEEETGTSYIEYCLHETKIPIRKKENFKRLQQQDPFIRTFKILELDNFKITKALFGVNFEFYEDSCSAVLYVFKNLSLLKEQYNYLIRNFKKQQTLGNITNVFNSGTYRKSFDTNLGFCFSIGVEKIDIIDSYIGE